MAAVFGTPVAAALFGIELLAFEWKPRSMAPVGIAVGTASIIRNIMAAHHLILAAPLFPVPPHGAFSSVSVIAAAAIGIACGLLAWVLTGAVYGAEDLFRKLPVHWAWWPAIGGLIIGVGRLIEPKALGVGYSVIAAELNGKIAISGLIELLVVKLVIWSSGLRSPFTSIVFAFELTHDTGSLLPLLVTCTIAHLISALVLKRSILTDGDSTLLGVIAPSDLLTADDSGNGTAGARTARQIMRPGPLVTYPDEILRAAADQMAEHWIGALPVISRDTRRLLGILTEFDLLKARQRHLTEERHQERVLRIRRLNPPPPAQGNAHGSTPPGNAATPPPDARTAAAPVAQDDGTHDTRRPDQAATFRPAGDSPEVPRTGSHPPRRARHRAARLPGTELRRGGDGGRHHRRRPRHGRHDGRGCLRRRRPCWPLNSG